MKNNFNHIIFTILFMCFITPGFSQPGETKRDKIEALRVTYIAKNVSLTTQEAQAFWPLYNEMNDKLDAIRKTFKQQYNKKTNYDFSTEKEAEDYLNTEIILKQKEFEIFKEYFEKFKKVISVKKVAAIRRAEEEFRKEIIKTAKGNL